MIKKIAIVICVCMIVMPFTGCTNFDQYKEYLEDYDEFQEYKAYKELLEQTQTVSQNEQAGITLEPQVSQGDTSQAPMPPETTQQTEDSIQNKTELLNLYFSQRNEVYTWENSYEKTMKINDLDQKILEAGDYSFADDEALFIGDSVTEGVGGNLNENGETISYVEYVNNALGFKKVLKYGKAGRTMAEYGDPTLSIYSCKDNLLYINAKIAVVYVGLNDYLTFSEEKRFGKLDSGFTSGYSGTCQAFSYFLNDLNTNQDFFFVTSYQANYQDTSTYADYDGIPSLNDYMEVQRILAERNGYHLIDLYSSGFMSQVDEDTMTNLFSDGVHPNDTGYRMLGQHIAAEILLYYEGISTQ